MLPLALHFFLTGHKPPDSASKDFHALLPTYLSNPIYTRLSPGTPAQPLWIPCISSCHSNLAHAIPFSRTFPWPLNSSWPFRSQLRCDLFLHGPWLGSCPRPQQAVITSILLLYPHHGDSSTFTGMTVAFINNPSHCQHLQIQSPTRAWILSSLFLPGPIIPITVLDIY